MEPPGLTWDMQFIGATLRDWKSKQSSRQPAPSSGLVLMLPSQGNGGLPAISFQGTVFHLPNHMNVHMDNSNPESKTLMSTDKKEQKSFLTKFYKKITTFNNLTIMHSPKQSLSKVIVTKWLITTHSSSKGLPKPTTLLAPTPSNCFHLRTSWYVKKESPQAIIQGLKKKKISKRHIRAYRS